MQCAELEKRIDQLLDEGRSPDDDRLVVGHAAGCSRCGALLDAYRRMLAGVDALPLPDLSQSFVLRTVDRAFSADQRLSDTANHHQIAGRRAVRDNGHLGDRSILTRCSRSLVENSNAGRTR